MLRFSDTLWLNPAHIISIEYINTDDEFTCKVTTTSHSTYISKNDYLLETLSKLI